MAISITPDAQPIADVRLGLPTAAANEDPPTTRRSTFVRRHHYRLFCRLDYEAEGRDKPLLVVVAGLDKPFRTTLKEADYAGIRALGAEYLARNPRSVV
jgi:hypothetical protein